MIEKTARGTSGCLRMEIRRIVECKMFFVLLFDFLNHVCALVLD